MSGSSTAVDEHPRSGELDLLIRENDEAAAQQLLSECRFDSGQWQELALRGRVALMRLAFDVGSRPTVQTIVTTVNSAHNYDYFGDPQPKVAREMCRAMCEGAASLGANVAVEVATELQRLIAMLREDASYIGEQQENPQTELLQFLEQWCAANGGSR